MNFSARVSSEKKMIVKKVVPAVLVTLLIASAWLLGQGKQNRDRPPSDVPGIPQVGGGYGSGSVSSPSPGRTPGAGGSRVPAGGSSPRVPVNRSPRIQVYDPSGHFSSRGHYSCQRFVDRLCRRYSFLRGREYLWRFAQGDSPLTPRMVQLALKDSLQAATSMVQLTEELQPLLLELQEGRLDRKSFERQSDEVLRQVRKLAKKVRKDYVLDYIEQRPQVKIPSRKEVRSIPELKMLVAQLHQMALQVREGISSFYDRDLTRVVSVKDLNQPSLKSISKGIEKLAKTIDKSVDRL